jgi:anaerobic selenocysteine-containing dehydrogenase
MPPRCLPRFRPKKHDCNSVYITSAGCYERPQRQGEQALLIHPVDAAVRQIETGSYVRVFNDRGSFEARAETSEDVMPGLVMANVGYWPSLNRSGTSVNVTSADKHRVRGLWTAVRCLDDRMRLDFRKIKFHHD